MRRIIFGLITIVGAGAVIASGMTGAFFGDTETSVGNTFAAGAIDLKVDNESYYNGNVCVPNPQSPGNYMWEGDAPFPVPGSLCSTSWTLDDLDKGLLFFNFTDVKPDDEGEDTISLHVQNDAWACMDISLTSNDDRSTTEPELQSPDTAENINNTWDGELAQNIQMLWWADDGDNVYEIGENTISGGIKTLYNLATSTPFSVALADATHNVWNPADPTPNPLPGGDTVYLAKAWCFGSLSTSTSAVAQDNFGHLPNSANGPQVRGTGVLCNGAQLNNLTQTDGATLDVAFRAVQARHNPDYICNEEKPRMATLTVFKNLITDNGGNETINSFQLKVVGTVVTPVTHAIPTQFAAGNYNVTETGVNGYQATFSGDCSPITGAVTLNPGDNKTCTITNNDIAPSITLIKKVSGGSADPVQFLMRIDGDLVPQNASVPVTANSLHTISEDPFSGYSFLSITGAGCPGALPGNVSLNEGQAIICTITNIAN